MGKLDLIIRNGTVVAPDGERPADIGVVDEKILAVESHLPGRAREVINAAGLHIFPGLIDSHVHFNDPGRAHWEGIETGSRALAAGGGTLFFDMPLNSSPPTLEGASFDAKLAAAKKSSLTDFAFWGGLVPGNLDKLDELSARGVIGFKAFMSNSGIEDFPCVDDATLKAGMKRAAKLGKLVAVHAESEAITSDLARRALADNRTAIRDYLDSRPVRAELDAIQRAIALAAETSCALHIVHVSCGAGVAFVAGARRQGVNVTCETCPHYLVLTEEDMLQLGAVAKCAPPLRSNSARTSLWQGLKSGQVTTIGSDHSPSPPDMKWDKNFFKVWGGISGVQHTLPLLITETRERSAELRFSALGKHESENIAPSWSSALQIIARLTSFNVAERFPLTQTKGRLAIGADADLALVDLNQQFTVGAEDLFYRHKQSPYVGRALTGRVIRTILRGQTIFRDGKIVSPPIGRHMKPLEL